MRLDGKSYKKLQIALGIVNRNLTAQENRAAKIARNVGRPGLTAMLDDNVGGETTIASFTTPGKRYVLSLWLRERDCHRVLYACSCDDFQTDKKQRCKHMFAMAFVVSVRFEEHEQERLDPSWDRREYAHGVLLEAMKVQVLGKMLKEIEVLRAEVKSLIKNPVKLGGYTQEQLEQAEGELHSVKCYMNLPGTHDEMSDAEDDGSCTTH